MWGGAIMILSRALNVKAFGAGKTNRVFGPSLSVNGRKHVPRVLTAPIKDPTNDFAASLSCMPLQSRRLGSVCVSNAWAPWNDTDAQQASCSGPETFWRFCFLLHAPLRKIRRQRNNTKGLDEVLIVATGFNFVIWWKYLYFVLK